MRCRTLCLLGFSTFISMSLIPPSYAGPTGRLTKSLVDLAQSGLRFHFFITGGQRVSHVGLSNLPSYGQQMPRRLRFDLINWPGRGTQRLPLYIDSHIAALEDSTGATIQITGEDCSPEFRVNADSEGLFQGAHNVVGQGFSGLELAGYFQDACLLQRIRQQGNGAANLPGSLRGLLAGWRSASSASSGGLKFFQNLMAEQLRGQGSQLQGHLSVEERSRDSGLFRYLASERELSGSNVRVGSQTNSPSIQVFQNKFGIGNIRLMGQLDASGVIFSFMNSNGENMPPALTFTAPNGEVVTMVPGEWLEHMNWVLDPENMDQLLAYLMERSGISKQTDHRRDDLDPDSGRGGAGAGFGASMTAVNSGS